MKRLSTLILFGCAMLFAQESFAQDGGTRKPKKKKSSAQVDTTSNKEVDTKKDQEMPGGSGTSDIAIDEPGSTRGKGKTNNNNKTSGDTIPPKENATAPKDAPAPTPPPAPEAPKPKEETANEAEVGSQAEPQKSAEAAPEPPAGAGGLDASGSGTSLTIDEAGTKRSNKPTDALNNKIDVNPTNLTIDEAGTKKSKTALDGSSDVPGVDSLKQKAGGKVLDLIRPK